MSVFTVTWSAADWTAGRPMHKAQKKMLHDAHYKYPFLRRWRIIVRINYIRKAWGRFTNYEPWYNIGNFVGERTTDTGHWLNIGDKCFVTILNFTCSSVITFRTIFWILGLILKYYL